MLGAVLMHSVPAHLRQSLGQVQASLATHGGEDGIGALLLTG